MFLVTQSCLTLCYPIDCSLPGSSVHGILWTRILEWFPRPPPADLPNPGIEPRSPALQADSTVWVTREAHIQSMYIYSQSYGFSSGHVWMRELDCEESWEQKNWCFWTVVLEKTLESPLDCKEIQPVHPKGDQSWIYIGRTDAEAEAPMLWPPDAKNWLIRKYSDSEKDWRQEEKGMTKNEMVGWHHQLNGHEFEHGDGDRQGSPACCSP